MVLPGHSLPGPCCPRGRRRRFPGVALVFTQADLKWFESPAQIFEVTLSGWTMMESKALKVRVETGFEVAFFHLICSLYKGPLTIQFLLNCIKRSFWEKWGYEEFELFATVRECDKNATKIEIYSPLICETFICHDLYYPLVIDVHSSPLVRSMFCPMKIDHIRGLTLYTGYWLV